MQSRFRPMALQDRDGRTKNKDNPTSIRRHVAFPSKQFLQVPNSLVVCPYRNELGRVAANLSDWPCTCFRITTAIQPHGPSRPLPAAQIWMVDQPSFSAGRRSIFGKHLFTPLLKILECNYVLFLIRSLIISKIQEYNLVKHKKLAHQGLRQVISSFIQEAREIS